MRHRSQHEECDEKTDTAIGDQGTGEYDGKHRASRAQTLGHKAGNGGHGAAVLHELAEQGSKQKNRKELHQESCSASHEGLRPMGEQRLPGQARCQDCGGWSEQKHAPPSIRQPD
jgi:hypothetical protein